jgi:two-component system sensor histidine kinase VicK
MVIPKITFQDKIMNVFAAITLGFILICFSRYSYYFKSHHFVKIKELEEKNVEIEHLSTQKEEILAFVAHDLRNPLNNIEALSGFLLLENENNSEAKMISTAAKQAKEIINDLIETVKLDQSDLRTEKQSIAPYLKKVVQKWKANTKREFLFIDNDIEANVYLNSSKLERVIDNLISNGLKFSSEDKPIEISLTQQKEKVGVIVRDFGIGIPEELKEHIFHQFSKAGRQGLLGEKSIGLGLHISKRIVEQHAGKLLIDSKENEGTAFTILLPLA